MTTAKEKKSLRPLLGLPEVQLGTQEPGAAHRETLAAAKQEIVRLTAAQDLAGLQLLLKRIWHKQQQFKVSPRSVLNRWEDRANPERSWELYIRALEWKAQCLGDYTLLYTQCQKAQKLIQSHQQIKEFCEGLDTQDSAGEVL
jgi:hypothetical protein